MADPTKPATPAEGRQMAAERLAGTAAFIHNTMPKDPAPLRPVQ